MNTIEVVSLSKQFKNLKVLENLSQTFESSKIYGLTGRNGSGKSVFLKIISGLYRPTSGNILYNGSSIKDSLNFPYRLRAFIEKPSFINYLTGFENLLLLSKICKTIGNNEILETLDLVNLSEVKDKPYKEYSFGMKQKLGIAATLMENPDVIILDEPFNGMDIESVKKIREYLVEQKSRGKLILLATHIKDDIKDICDEEFCFEFNG